MFLFAAHRTAILLFLIFLAGVWIGWLLDWQQEERNNSKGIEISNEMEQRTSKDAVDAVLAKKNDCSGDHFRNKLDSLGASSQNSTNSQLESQPNSIASGFNPSWEQEDGESISENSDKFFPNVENENDSYSVLVDAAKENSEIEASPQAIEEDIFKSFEEAGIPSEETYNRTENLMEMIIQQDQQAPVDYPNISVP